MAHTSEVMDTRGHHLDGVQWPVVGSKGDEYTVTMYDRGWECTCPAWRKCKHIKGVEQGLVNDKGE